MLLALNLGFSILKVSATQERPRGCYVGLTAGLGDKVAFFPLAAPPPLNANQSLPALAQWGQSTAGEEGLAWLASRRERRKETDLGMTLM